MQVLDYTGLRDRGIRYSKKHLWDLCRSGRFPKPVKLTPGRNAWLASEIDAWIRAKLAERDGSPEAA